MNLSPRKLTIGQRQILIPALLVLLIIGSAQTGIAQPGTTIITHGFQIDGVFPSWPQDMGVAIATFGPPGTPLGTVLVQSAATGNWTQVFGSGNPAGQIVLCFDWAESSSWAPGVGNRVGTGHAAADALYAALRDPQIIGSLSGVNLLEFAPGVPRPLHFIGHSRGATVNNATARRLVVAGIPIDQITHLDPHPVGPTAGLLDPSLTTWEGISFAESYWRADGCDFDYGCLVGFDFDGEPVAGAYSVDLGLDDFSFVDNRLFSCSLEHILVHTWYYGTIDLTSSTDGNCTITRGLWYQSGGAGEGYFYSSNGGGASQRPCGPLGGCPDAGRVVATPTDPIVIGDFGFGSSHEAGWNWLGGGGSGDIISESGNAFLVLSSFGTTRTHNRFFIPSAIDQLSYDARVFDSSPNTTVQIAILEPNSGASTVIDSFTAGAVTGWQNRSVPIPSQYTGRTVRLRAQISPTTTGAMVDLDNFTLIEGLADPLFRRGDCNADQLQDISDVVFSLSALFGIGPAGSCASACDMNDDSTVDISDPIALLNALFGMGVMLPLPYPGCGIDPTPDGLMCAGSSCP